MSTSRIVHGLMAEFLSAAEIVSAARRAREAGYRDIDAYTPYMVEGLSAELGMRRSRTGSVFFSAEWVGASVDFFMQSYAAALNSPVRPGGRPYNSWPAFV